jgi:metal transporter CNNM
MKLAIWIGIVLCTVQAALLAGLNLAVFSVGRLRLEVEAAGGSRPARAVLALRRNSNFVLSTIIWGNVAANVLLTLLSRDVLAGALGFVFSTVVITCLGEIVPQAYFTRHALPASARLAPLLKVYGVLFYVVAKPTALLLDWWLGPEAVSYLRERDFRVLISQHVNARSPEVGALEATGALNFLDLDDIPLGQEGAPLDPRSVIELPAQGARPILPNYQRSPADPFLQRINASGKRWIIIVNRSGQPYAALDAHWFLRSALLGAAPSAAEFLSRPIIATDEHTPLGNVMGRLTLRSTATAEDVLLNNVILLWSAHKRIITSSDLLGRLLRGIAQRQPS